MFANAYDLAQDYTRPAIISVRLADNTVSSGVGAFVMLNADGWFATAAHLLQSYLQHQQDLPLYQGYLADCGAIESNTTLDYKRKQKAISRLTYNPEWIVDHAFWWSDDAWRVSAYHIHNDVDLAIARIDNFTSSAIRHYPRIIEPNKIRCGTSLCRLGFPFHEIRSSWDNDINGFRIDPAVFPIPRFPIDGILTRIMERADASGKPVGKMIETSGPGLRGQSGGPIFDVHGNLWGIQSVTNHLRLGFEPVVKLANGKEVVEHQFINVGIGSHSETLRDMLSSFKIAYTSA